MRLKHKMLLILFGCMLVSNRQASAASNRSLSSGPALRAFLAKNYAGVLYEIFEDGRVEEYASISIRSQGESLMTELRFANGSQSRHEVLLTRDADGTCIESRWIPRSLRLRGLCKGHLIQLKSEIPNLMFGWDRDEIEYVFTPDGLVYRHSQERSIKEYGEEVSSIRRFAAKLKSETHNSISLFSSK